MNTRFFMAVWGLATLVSLPAHAQPAPKLPVFQSAFEGYQPHTDDKPADWKAANDTTARIGGWRAYAKEAAAPAVAPTPATPPPSGRAKP
ncbi:MAG: hypothetical protein ACKVOT_14695 [Polaromonas sp.]